MSEATTFIAYSGPKLEQGMMDVRDLAPALSSLGEACERAHKLINKSDKQISVNVRTLRKGSFGIDFLVLSLDLDSAKTVLETDGYRTVKEILVFIGLLKDVGIGLATLSVSLFYFMKLLKGRKPVKTLSLGSPVKIRTPDGTIIEIPEEIWMLYSDRNIRQCLEQIVSPLKQEGIDALEIKESESGDVVEKITKEHLPYFAEPEEEKTIEEKRKEVFLRVDTSHITGAGKKQWSFSTTGKGRVRKISAFIKDEDYIRDVESGRTLFRHGVCIHAILISRITKQKGEDAKEEYEIEKVIEHNPGKFL